MSDEARITLQEEISRFIAKHQKLFETQVAPDARLAAAGFAVFVASSHANRLARAKKEGLDEEIREGERRVPTDRDIVDAEENIASKTAALEREAERVKKVKEELIALLDQMVLELGKRGS